MCRLNAAEEDERRFQRASRQQPCLHVLCPAVTSSIIIVIASSNSRYCLRCVHSRSCWDHWPTAAAGSGPAAVVELLLLLLLLHSRPCGSCASDLLVGFRQSRTSPRCRCFAVGAWACLAQERAARRMIAFALGPSVRTDRCSTCRLVIRLAAAAAVPLVVRKATRWCQHSFSVNRWTDHQTVKSVDAVSMQQRR